MNKELEKSIELRDRFPNLVWPMIKHCPEFDGHTKDPELRKINGLGDVYTFGNGIVARVRVQERQPTLFRYFTLRLAREYGGETEIQKIRAIGVRAEQRLLQIHAWLSPGAKAFEDCAICRLGALLDVAEKGEKNEAERRGGRSAFLAIPWTAVPNVWVWSMSDPGVKEIKIGQHNLFDTSASA